LQYIQQIRVGEKQILVTQVALLAVAHTLEKVAKVVGKALLIQEALGAQGVMQDRLLLPVLGGKVVGALQQEVVVVRILPLIPMQLEALVVLAELLLVE
jgi:hypothetical protein